MTHPDTTNSPEAWVTRHDSGDMLWLDYQEALTYSDEEYPPEPLYLIAHPQQAVAAIPDRSWIVASKTKPLKSGMYRCRWSLYQGEEKRLFWDGRQWIGESWDGTLRTPVRFGMAEGKYEDKWFSEVDAAPQPTQQDSAQQGEKEKP